MAFWCIFCPKWLGVLFPPFRPSRVLPICWRRLHGLNFFHIRKSVARNRRDDLRVQTGSIYRHWLPIFFWFWIFRKKTQEIYGNFMEKSSRFFPAESHSICRSKMGVFDDGLGSKMFVTVNAHEECKQITSCILGICLIILFVSFSLRCVDTVLDLKATHRYSRHSH